MGRGSKCREPAWLTESLVRIKQGSKAQLKTRENIHSVHAERRASPHGTGLCSQNLSLLLGSTHTLLGPYWSEELGKKEMRAFQCSRRGGELDINLRPDGRVDIKGGAVIVLEGTLTA